MTGPGFAIGKGFTVSPAFSNNILSGTLSNTATGGTVPAGQYFSKFSFLTANGETLPNISEPSTTLSGTTSTLTYTSSYSAGFFPTGVTGWNIYLGTVSGKETLQASLPNTVNTYTATGPLAIGAAMPSYNTTAYQDVNLSALGLPDGSEVIIQNIYYNGPAAFGVYDGTNLTLFDGDTLPGNRLGLNIHCNGTQWLRVFNQSSTSTLQFSVDGLQLV